jgi:hypothetical protein
MLEFAALTPTYTSLTLDLWSVILITYLLVSLSHLLMKAGLPLDFGMT